MYKRIFVLFAMLFVMGCTMPPYESRILQQTSTNPTIEAQRNTKPKSASVAKSSSTDSINGFRGIKWGTKIGTLTDMVGVYDRGEDKAFRRQGDKLTIGKATLEDIRYVFWRGQFYSVSIEAKGHVNWIKLRDAAKAKYTKLYQPNESEYIEDYYAFYPETYVRLKHNEFSKEASLFIASKLILSQRKLTEEQEAKKAAESDF